MIEINRKTFRDIDWPLLLAPIALTAFGCIGIYSTAPKTDFVSKQLMALGIGLALAFSIMFTDYRKIIHDIAPFIYGGVLFLLVLVLSPAGSTINGNKAWLHIPGLPSIQPSEFAKVATILMLSRYLAQKRPGKFTLRDAAIMAGITMPPIILIAFEHDTGTMLVFGAILAAFY